jgi:hypothetical protein
LPGPPHNVADRFAYLASLFFKKLFRANIPGDMVANNGPRRQALRKPPHLFRVGLALLPVRGIFPPYPAISRVGITSAPGFRIGGLFLAGTMRRKSNNVITIPASAKRFTVAAIGAAKPLAIFCRASHYLNRTRLHKIAPAVGAAKQCARMVLDSPQSLSDTTTTVGTARDAAAALVKLSVL